MKPLSLILCLASLSPWANAAETDLIRTVFTNQDELSGSLVEIDPTQLVLNSPLLDRPTSFFLDAIREIQLNPEPKSSSATHEATAWLTNGDQIHGNLISISPTLVELETTFSSRLQLNRLMISELKIAENLPFLYCGPSSLKGWTQNLENPPWSYATGQFKSNCPGSIARDFEFPSEGRIAFDISHQGPFAFKIHLFSPDLSSERPTAGYEFIFRQQTVTVRNSKTLKDLGYSRDAGALQEDGVSHLEIRYSQQSGKISLLVNQELVETWTEPEPDRSPLGHGLRLIATQDCTVQLSKLEIAKWDPETEPLPDADQAGANPALLADEDADAPPQTPPPATKSDRIELRNGDSLVGEILNIQDGHITLKTPFRDVTLPIEALRSVVLAPAALERCKREKGDVRISTPDGSSIIFQLASLKNQRLSGHSQNFGQASFDLSAIQRIEFNLYPRNRAELEERGDFSGTRSAAPTR